MPRLLALDVGEVRIGVAISDASGFLASPYTTLHVSRDESQTWQAIASVIEESGAEGLVVGLPISLDGQIHFQAERVLAFVERLKEQIALPVALWDERLSTVEAARLLAERNEQTGGSRSRSGKRPGKQGGTRRKRRVQHEIDALAATVILQEYLDSQVHLSKTGNTE